MQAPARHVACRRQMPWSLPNDIIRSLELLATNYPKGFVQRQFRGTIPKCYCLCPFPLGYSMFKQNANGRWAGWTRARQFFVRADCFVSPYHKTLGSSRIQPSLALNRLSTPWRRRVHLLPSPVSPSYCPTLVITNPQTLTLALVLPPVLRGLVLNMVFQAASDGDLPLFKGTRHFSSSPISLGRS